MNEFGLSTLDELVRDFKRGVLRGALVRNKGNRCRAAEELGIHRNTCERMEKQCGVSAKEIRQQARQAR